MMEEIHRAIQVAQVKKVVRDLLAALPPQERRYVLADLIAEELVKDPATNLIAKQEEDL